MMRFLLVRAVNPAVSLLNGLRAWNDLARDLREGPRRRTYQHDRISQFLY
jgi:hypothetical protein